jgi:hypothetical protein
MIKIGTILVVIDHVVIEMSFGRQIFDCHTVLVITNFGRHRSQSPYFGG